MFFVIATIITIKRNAMSRQREFATYVAALLGGLAMFVGSTTSCATSTGDKFHSDEVVLASVVVGIIFIDFVLCCVLIGAIHYQQQVFEKQEKLLLEHVLEGNAFTAKRKLQLLKNTIRHFDRFVRPLRVYPYFFILLSLPGFGFLFVRTAIALSAALMAISLRGAIFTVLYFLDRESREQVIIRNCLMAHP